MRGLCRLLVPVLGLAAPVTPGIAVRETQGRVDVTAAAASLADVLDRLARQTGMKIVYEGPAPRQLVTLSLVGRSPAEAVSAILEGQGLNYALVLDPTATRVEKLLVTGTSSSASGASAARHVPMATIQPRYIPPDPEPEPDDAVEEAPPAPEPPPTTETLPVVTPAASPIAPNGPFPPGTLAPPPMGAPVSPLNPNPSLTPLVPAVPVPQPTPTPPATPP